MPVGDPCGDFDALTPDVLLDAVETACDRPLTALAHPLNSYINRVYELQTVDGERLIAKFYRPGRWTREAVEAEHRFVMDCAEEEIPVVAPCPLQSGSTLADVKGILFAVYPKRRGRELEATCDEDWRRLGRLLGRMHTVGDRDEAPSRVRLHPEASTRSDIDQLLEGGFVSPQHRQALGDVTGRILETITPLFADVEMIRIHGDCHNGNLLERPGEGILVIDFDDMAVGPPAQDMWMLLPDHAHKARRELDLILDGYEDFRAFDYRSLRCLEGLRAMRILYFQAWCSRQVGDSCFERNFPNWGTPAFWRREVADLEQQLRAIHEYLATFRTRL